MVWELKNSIFALGDTHLIFGSSKNDFGSELRLSIFFGLTRPHKETSHQKSWVYHFLHRYNWPGNLWPYYQAGTDIGIWYLGLRPLLTTHLGGGLLSRTKRFVVEKTSPSVIWGANKRSNRMAYRGDIGRGFGAVFENLALIWRRVVASDSQKVFMTHKRGCGFDRCLLLEPRD